MKRVMVVVAIVMVLTLALSAGTASAGSPGWGGGYGWEAGYGGGQQVYIVRPGDTLSAIAFRFGVSPFEVARVNGIFNPNLIFSGQCLVIPAHYRPGPGPMPGPVYNPGYCQPDCNWNAGWDNCYSGCYGGGYYGNYWGSQVGWGYDGGCGYSSCERGPSPLPQGFGRQG